ncbi:SLYX protein homolog [Cardiobacterium hominis]|uniref:SLYX protein homolog n=1 Tax=Cardiobacterium hominis TaxID=2718 RepID=A0A1C3H6K6_9GAMM|nr:SlyX family protein [Cardiobacterium hominis]SAM70504.1 SLYX protein homolog [Cardiobacterium hominis]
MNERDEERLAQMEIRLAYQEDLLATLNATVVELRAALDLQQGQLRLLWQQLQEHGDASPRSLAEEIPPHY